MTTHHTTDHDDAGDLVALLRAWAKGDYPREAAVDLLIAHRTWLARDDFRATCITRGSNDGDPVAWIDFTTAADVVDGSVPPHLPASDSEHQILALAATLAGTPVTWTLDTLLTGLDDRNVALVLDAVAHAAGWHETGHTHTTTGHLPEVTR